MKGMAGMKDMKMTHRLMVYIKDSQKGYVEQAKVGYLITNPDGSKGKAMAMGMGDGFGADVNMMKKGGYKIKTKFVAGGKKILDEFTYHIE